MVPGFFLMGVVNPDFYGKQYQDTNESREFRSDISKQLVADLTMMNAQWDFDNAWYNAHVSAGAKYDELRDLGINQLSAARSVAGNPQNMSPGVSPTVSGTGQNAQLAQALDALNTVNGSLGAFNNAAQTDIQREQTRANVRNLDSQTANNLAQNPFVGSKMKSEIVKNEAEAFEATEHGNTLAIQRDEIISQANLNDAQAAQIRQVMSRYDEVTDAQITLMQNEANLYFEQRITEQHKQTNIDADTVLKGSQTYENYAHADLDLSMSKYYDQETQQLMTINKFCSITGVPLNADNLQTLNYYESKGDFVGAQRYLNCIFDCAATHESATQSQSLPADLSRQQNNAYQQYFYSHPKTAREALFRGFFWRGKHSLFNQQTRPFMPGFNPVLTR